MKIKNVAITLGLSAFAALAVGAGLKAGAREVAKAIGAGSTIYMNLDSSWSDVRVYEYNSNDDKKSEWPGASATYTGFKNEEGKNIYSFEMDENYAYMIVSFSIPDWAKRGQTVDLTKSNLTANGLYTTTQSEGKFSTGSYTYAEKTVYLYDVDGYYAAPKAYTFVNDAGHNEWPGTAMTKVKDLTYGSVYSFTYWDGYNKVIFDSEGSSDQTADLTIDSTNPFYVIHSNSYNGHARSGGWFAEADAVVAADFAYDTMKLTTYDAGGKMGDDNGNGQCATLFSSAKTAYQSLDEDELACVKAVFPESLTRLGEWARINDEEFDPNSGFASSALSLVGVTSTNNAPIVIVVLSSLVLLSAGGFFFIRKRKEDK